ncbi:hypothetical protein BOTBODRAFT_182367 [Botryobasidium botryosum FD-172 SS1]|uniref:Uncharacterized protein n=1 Tax=Botryobasidium botryosum (strain FD-172 SS1) TaxID=930990 RepID=A0A067LRK1_BOTB1|nr:hypothetical protein BOTBODRAFT_182367 [Botryobasidium botryosum FD-172 SS1]
MVKKTSKAEYSTQDILSLKGPARTWLQSHTDEYQAFDTTPGKADRQGKLDFLARIGDNFIKHFKLAPYKLDDGSMHNPLEGCVVIKKDATLGNLREAIKRWFRNNHSERAARQRVVTKATQFLAASSSKPRKFNAQSAYAFDHATTIREKTSEMISYLGLDTTSNLKIWNQILGEMWGKLSASEQEIYQRRATSLNDAEVPEIEQVAAFSNQSNLGDMLFTILDSLIGFGQNQVGDACFHLQYATKAIDGMVHVKSMCVTPKDMTSFEASHTGYRTSITELFTKWATEGLKDPEPLPQPPALDCPDLVIARDGNPLLPTLDEDNTPNRVFAAVLDKYFSCKWNYEMSGRGTRAADDDIPWEAITSDPKKFIPPGHIPTEVKFMRPSKMKGIHTQLLYDHLIQGQSSKGAPFRFKIPKDYEPPCEDDEDQDAPNVGPSRHVDDIDDHESIDIDKETDDEEAVPPAEATRADSALKGNQDRDATALAERNESSQSVVAQTIGGSIDKAPQPAGQTIGDSTPQPATQAPSACPPQSAMAEDRTEGMDPTTQEPAGRPSQSATGEVLEDSAEGMDPPAQAPRARLRPRPPQKRKVSEALPDADAGSSEDPESTEVVTQRPAQRRKVAKESIPPQRRSTRGKDSGDPGVCASLGDGAEKTAPNTRAAAKAKEATPSAGVAGNTRGAASKGKEPVSKPKGGRGRKA